MKNIASISIFFLLFFILFPDATQAQRRRKKKEQSLSWEEKEKQSESEHNFSDAVKEFELGNYTKAISYIHTSLDLTPNSAGIHYMMAKIYTTIGEVDKALPYALKAVDLSQDNRYFYILLSDIYRSKLNTLEAIDVLEKMIKKIPFSEQYNYDLAELYIKQKKYSDAIKCYDKLEKLMGVSEELARQKQSIYMQMNKPELAIQEIKLLVEANPEENSYKIMLAEMYFNMNKNIESEKVLDQVLKSNPSNPYAHLLLFDMYRVKTNRDKAFEHLEKAFISPDLSIDQKISIITNLLPYITEDAEMKKHILVMVNVLEKIHSEEAKSFSIAGDVLLMTENKKDALNKYIRAVSIDSTKFKIWQNIVGLQSELGQTDSMIKYSKVATEIFPTQSILWYYLGTGYLIKNDYSNSIEALEQSKNLAGSNKNLINQINSQLGDSYNGIKDYLKSDMSYEEALKHDPTNAHVLNNYSYFLSLRKDKLALAKEMGKKLINQHPNDPTYLDTYGWVLYVMKEYSEAAILLEKAANGSKNGTIVEHYADTLYQLGEKEKALEYWKKAKSYGETSEFINKKISDQKLYE